jgi:uncharacterized protein YcfL
MKNAQAWLARDGRTPIWTVGLLLLVSGCSSAPLGTPTNTYVGTDGGKSEEFIGDRELARNFVMVGVKTKRESEHLIVQFDLKNTTPRDLAIEWSIDWLDASGFRIDTNRHWRPAIVTGMGFESIQETAPVPEATTFQLQMRRPTPVH